MPRSPDTSPQTLDLLEALLAAPDCWQHGYQLRKQTGLSSGTLYPILIRLSDRGLLQARWQEPERPGLPPRHAYRLTPHGEQVARERLARRHQQPRRTLRPGPAPQGAP
jgi:PadR family transcriptional regulator PadR